MKESITAIITQYLPRTPHQPHLLLRSNGRLVQLYTNYPCVTGLSARQCAEHFNQTPCGLTAIPQGNFVNFVLDCDFADRQITALAQTFYPTPEALPDRDMAAYLQYVISVTAAEYPCDAPDVPYTKQETQLVLWTLYLAEQPPQNRQKRKAEFITRLSALLNTYILSQLSMRQKHLLLAAASVLTPQV